MKDYLIYLIEEAQQKYHLVAEKYQIDIDTNLELLNIFEEMKIIIDKETNKELNKETNKEK